MFLNILWAIFIAWMLALAPATHATPTAIYGNKFFNANPNIVQGQAPVGWGVDLTVPLEEVRKKQREQEILHHKHEHPAMRREVVDRNIVDSAILLSEKKKREEN